MNKLVTHTKKHPFIETFEREVERFLKSKALIFTTLIGPAIVLFLLYWLFSAGVVRELPVAVVDNDHTNLSRNIARFVNASPSTAVIAQSMALPSAQKAMNRGDVEAIVVIPEGTEKSILRGESSPVVLYTNNTNLVKSGALKSGLYKTLSTVSAGIKLQVYQKTGATYYQAMQKIQPVKIQSHLLFNPFANYSYFLALGLIPVMLTVFVFLGTTYAVGIELKKGSAKDLLETAGGNIWIALAAKILPYTIIFFVHVLFMNIVLFQLQGTPIAGNTGILLISELFMILAYQTLAIFFLWITSNLRLSLSLGSAFTMMSLTFSGLTFPAMGMPLIARLFSLLFPYTTWLKVFMGQSLQGAPVKEAVPKLWILLIYVGIGVLTFPGFKKRLIHEVYWYKD